MRTVGQMGGRGLQSVNGGSGGRSVRASRAWTVDRADGRTGGRGGGPGFKRHHSSHPISLLGTQSACLVRARVCRVPGSAKGSKRIPSQTPVLSTWTHLPRLSASVLGAKNGILLSALKNGFNKWRWQRNAKLEASNSWSRGRGWRWGQEKAQSGRLRTRHFPQPRADCVPRMGIVASAMVSSHSHEVHRIPPFRLLVAT